MASVTVAYNGESVLENNLEGIHLQTRRVDEIIVVDNASRDDTVLRLRSKYPEVTVLSLPENRGVGGGLEAGLAYAALQKQYDWVWIFDQDSVPEPCALEQLLSGLHHLNGTGESIAVLAPQCVHRRTGMTTYGLAWRGARLLPTSPNKDQPVTFMDTAITSGCLVRSSAIEAVGLPRADFFMDFVDHEHCLRMRRSGFNIAIVRDSRIQHALGEPAKFSFLGRTVYWSDHDPWREYYMTRNRVYTLWQYYSRPAVKALELCGLIRHAVEIVLFGKHKAACLRMMYYGFVDGRTGRLGIRSFSDLGEDARCGGND